jgi:hypothetical protein
MALEQLESAESIVVAALIITFGAVMLALAVAFAVGGTDVARRAPERQLQDAERRQEPPPPVAHPKPATAALFACFPVGTVALVAARAAGERTGRRWRTIASASRPLRRCGSSSSRGRLSGLS